MARTVSRPRVDGRRRVGRELAGLGVEQELQHLIGAERGHVDEPVGAVGQDGVRVPPGRDHLDRLGLDEPAGGDRAYGDLVAAVGSREQEAARGVHRDVGHAVGKRRGRLLRQCAGVMIDRIGEDAERLRARDGIQQLLVGAHRHRHHQLGRLGLADWRERAARLVHDVGVDVAVLVVRHVDERLGGGRRTAAGRARRKCRQTEARQCLQGWAHGQSSSCSRTVPCTTRSVTSS